MYLQRYKDLLYRGSQPLFIHKKAPDKKVLGSGAKARCPTETRTLAKLAKFFDCGAPCPSRRAFPEGLSLCVVQRYFFFGYFPCL